jgi:hypothetical protein
MPFLKNSPEEDDSYQHPVNSSSIITPPLANESTTAADDYRYVWTVKTLFPLTGSASIGVAALFVIYFIRDCSKQKVTGGGSTPTATEEKGAGVTKRGRMLLEIVVISLLSLMFFLYVGLEVAYGTFLTVFSVRSKLGKYPLLQYGVGFVAVLGIRIRMFLSFQNPDPSVRGTYGILPFSEIVLVK